MRSVTQTILTAVCLVALSVASAAAQALDPSSTTVLFDQRRQPARAKAPTSSSPTKVGVRIFGGLEVESMAAPLSFKTEFGSSTLKGFAGGADITDVWRHAFLRFSLSHMSATGTRAVGTVSVGTPTTVSLTPIEIGGGWRFASRRPGQSAVPFVGAGLVALKFSQTSPGALAGEDVSATYNGLFLLGGLDVRVSKVLFVSGEADYRSVKNEAAAGSELQAVSENNLGGMAFRVLVGIRK